MLVIEIKLLSLAKAKTKNKAKQKQETGNKLQYRHITLSTCGKINLFNCDLSINRYILK